MMAALEQTPALLEAVSAHDPAPETRAMGVDTFKEDGITLNVQIRRPYTDLAYW